MYFVSDFLTTCLLIYAGCHIYLTLSTLLSQFISGFTKRIDDVLYDFKRISRSIEQMSNTFENVSEEFESTSRATRTSQSQLLVIIYVMVLTALVGFFRINLSDLVSSVIPILRGLFGAYTSGSVRGQTPNEYGMNEEMRTYLMNELTRQITGNLNTSNANINYRIPESIIREMREIRDGFQNNVVNNNVETDTDSVNSDITEIIVEDNTNVRQETQTQTQMQTDVNTPVSDDLSGLIVTLEGRA